MWDLLVWQGKHPQAPVAVAAKPYYFSELNIKRTMRNILKHHPKFFASQHMLDTVRNGDIVALDANFFCEVCQQCMSRPESSPALDSLERMLDTVHSDDMFALDANFFSEVWQQCMSPPEATPAILCFVAHAGYSAQR